MNATTEKLTILVHARPLESQPEAPVEFVYHASFKGESGLSHWNSRGETVLARVVDRAREVAQEAGYETNEQYEVVEV